MHVVIVEDNKVLAKSINDVLVREGYTTTCFDNGLIAYTWLESHQTSYDLILLDVLLPGMNGFEIIKSLRNEKIMVPTLMLTSKGAPEDIVEGLEVGADDYLKKPFVFSELLARIKSLLRRPKSGIIEKVALTPDVTVDLAARKVFKEGTEVHLTTKEFSILSYFLHNPNILLSQQTLYDHVFDFAEVQMSNTIEVHIKNLRKKLKTTQHKLPVTTIRNAGYRFDYET